MTRGQDSLMIALDQPSHETPEMSAVSYAPVLVKPASDTELAEHEAYLAGLAKSGNCVWNG